MSIDYTFESPLKRNMTLYLRKCEQELADSTFTTRLRHIKDFDSYLSAIGFQDGDVIDEPLVTCWLSNHNHLSPGSMHLLTNSVRLFLRFHSNIQNIWVYEPPLRSFDDSYSPYIFTDQEMVVIFQLVDNYQSGTRNALPYIEFEFPMVIRLLESCGFRLNELITTKMTEVDLNSGIIKMINSKGNKQRLVPLQDEMAEILRKYCRIMHLQENSSAFLFPRKTISEHLKIKDIDNRFLNVLVKAGIRNKRSAKKYSREACVHCLRHRFTMKAIQRLLAMGIELNDTTPYLSFYLGHSSVIETEMYMKFLSEFFPEELDKFASTASKLLPDETIWNDWM